MAADDLICTQLTARGKWHVMQSSRLTWCGTEIPLTGYQQRYLTLIDSCDRCRHDECIAARNRHAGRL